MVVLNFTLSEDGVAVLHDALACMFKFSDDVCLEARKDKVPAAPLPLFSPVETTPCFRCRVTDRYLVDSDYTQHLKVCICLLFLRRQQVLLTLQL